MNSIEKIDWHGKIIGIQPRIRLLRSFDERSHNYLGYNLFIDGIIYHQEKQFIVAIGTKTQEKFRLEPECIVQGCCSPVEDPKNESAEYYKVSKLKIIGKNKVKYRKPPPWFGVPPSLETYRARGHRRLATKVYHNKCNYCIWGCNMPVEIIVDHWNPKNKKHRFETFCYGPKSCSIYHAGATRKVPGRKGMIWEEEDWVDEEATSHRGPDE